MTAFEELDEIMKRGGVRYRKQGKKNEGVPGLMEKVGGISEESMIRGMVVGEVTGPREGRIGKGNRRIG